MEPERSHEQSRSARPRLTACSLCAGETLEGRDALPGGQWARLERLSADGVARVSFSECLDECERGDVVVVRPAPVARRVARARPVWLERVAGDDLTGHVREWLVAGGPGVARLPAPLVEHVIVKGGAGREGGAQVAAPELPVAASDGAACH